MAPENCQLLDFSKTQRVILLIDLDPILTLQNPGPYFSAVISAANRLLCFPPLSATLSAFKLFFSSLSLLRSAAVLPRQLSTRSLSFNLPSETLSSLSTTLNCVSTLTDLPNSPFRPRASNAASSLLQLVHDYAWEIEQDKLLGEDGFMDSGFVKVPANLAVLFSPIRYSVNSLVDYLELREFNDAFCVVREQYAIRDIHLCWVDVEIDESGIVEAGDKKNGSGEKLAVMGDEIKKFGWGFCSSDLIIFCSALLPLGLIYPRIGVSFDFDYFSGFGKKCGGELNLDIMDVIGMPLECKFCDLEFVSLKSLPCPVETDDIFNGSESRDSHGFYSRGACWTLFGKGSMKLHVKNVHCYDAYQKTAGSSDIILVRECFQESQKNKKKSGDGFFADKVLEMLHKEKGGFTCRNHLPSWQMFLSFLYTKGYWALVSLSGSDEDTIMGSLKPFTADLAILHILDTGHVSLGGKCDGNITRETCIEEMNDSNTCSGSQTDASTSGNCNQYGDGKRKRIQRHLYQEMNWSSFSKAASEGFYFDLFELYTARYLEKFKKLKFLKCWMKQISKVDHCFIKTLQGIKSVEETFVCDTLPSDSSQAQEEVLPFSKVETIDAFLAILIKRIHDGLESGMDLQKLAERVVKSSIHWLQQKCMNEIDTEGKQMAKTSDDPSSENTGEKIIETVLRSPKEMKKINQDSSSSSSSENLVRDYELQILLRMEILQSDVAATLRESRKHKLLKEICSLLEIIQFLVGGGIHGHMSLYDYVERTIRARYSGKLADAVKNIYDEMELLPFGEEDEAPSLLFNSEDSNQSWRDRNEKCEGNHSVSAEGESSQPPIDCLQESGMDDYTRSLNEARERRERARRFAPFISKALDLQRVWAPKQQPKATKSKHCPRPNKLKRKNRQTPTYSVVCETPMTGNKRACSGATPHHLASSSCSKALFRDFDE